MLDRLIFPLIIVKSIVQVASNLAIVLVSTNLINQMENNVEKATILKVAMLGVLIIFALKVLGSFTNKYLVIRKNACDRNYNFKVGDKALEVDFPQLENRKVDELKQHIREDNNWGAGILSIYQAFESLVQNVVTVIGNLVVVLPFFLNKGIYKSSYLYLLVILFVVITVISVFINSKYLKTYVYKVMDQMSHNVKLFFFFLFDGAFDYKSGKDVRIYQAQSLIDSHVGKGELGYLKKQYSKLALASGIGSAVEGIGAALLTGGTYLTIALLASANSVIKIGSVIRYASCLSTLVKSLNKLTEDITSISKSLERQGSRMQFFDIEEVLEKGNETLELKADEEFAIEFKDVSFRYDPTQEYVLNHISVKIKKGDCTAIVGLNGSGKTTFIKLLCRLYDPTEGEILLNGVNIKKYRYEDYMKILSVVFQDFQLFSFGLGENIAGSQLFDEDRVKSCIQEAGLEERYSKMSKGMNTSLYRNLDEEGVEVSGGEAQKIAIARALYKQASLMILDEPTAALDPVAEYDIYTRLNEITKGRTTIFISHRLYSCKFCERIIVFQDGKIVEEGVHKELLERKGLYQDMWNTQVQYYMDAVMV